MDWFPDPMKPLSEKSAAELATEAEYCGAAEPPARWWRSHLSGLLEPPRLSTGYLAFSGSNP